MQQAPAALPSARAARFRATDDPRADISMSRWAFLEQPWYRDWVSAIQPEMVDARADGTALCRPQFRRLSLYLPWQLSLVQPGRIAKLRQATELSGLMLRRDPEAWRFLKAEPQPWFTAFQLDHLDVEALEPRMNIVMAQQWGNQREQIGALVNCREFLLSSEPSKDAAFREARRKIVAADSNGRLRGWRIPLSIEFQPAHRESAEIMQQYVEEVIAIVQEVQAKARDESDGSYPFHLEAIQLELNYASVGAVGERLGTLMTLGVPVELRFKGSTTGKLVDQMSRTLSALSTLPPCDPVHTFHMDAASLPECAAFCSMARSSSLFRRVVTRNTGATQKHGTYLRWLTAAFFMAAHSPQELVLHGFDATGTDLDHIESMLQSENPAQYLLLKEVPSELPTVQFVTLEPNTMIETPMRRCWSSAESLLIPTQRRLFAACELSGSLMALVVPGFGICRVRKGDVEVSQAPRHDGSSDVWLAPRAPASNVHVLKIVSFEDGPTQIPRYLELVGARLRVLAVDTWSTNPLHDADLLRICRACPQLVRLAITSGVFSALVGLFRSGACPFLRSLSLCDVLLPKHEFIAFVDELADPSTRASQTLEELEYGVTRRKDPWLEIDEDVVAAILRMLPVNRRLSMLRLPLTSKLQQQRSLLLQHNGELTNARKDALSMRSKLALLSAVQRLSDADTSAMSRLDSLCMAHIFSFFGRRLRRCVVVDRPELEGADFSLW
ncbi:hypothetical protein ATCC90586_000665 [Pythium insidiosum]|nr:hypothetical protein ATCC90586_000665 [Pythium insidiosum]